MILIHSVIFDVEIKNSLIHESSNESLFQLPSHQEATAWDCCDNFVVVESFIAGVVVPEDDCRGEARKRLHQKSIFVAFELRQRISVSRSESGHLRVLDARTSTISIRLQTGKGMLFSRLAITE